MKTDARVRYTKKVIQDAFLEILKEKPVAKITVKLGAASSTWKSGLDHPQYLILLQPSGMPVLLSWLVGAAA